MKSSMWNHATQSKYKNICNLNSNMKNQTKYQGCIKIEYEMVKLIQIVLHFARSIVQC